MGRRLWDGAKVWPRREVQSKLHLVVTCASVHHGHDLLEKLQSHQSHYVVSYNWIQDVLHPDHGNLCLVPGLKYSAPSIVLICYEYDPYHCREVVFQDFQDELDGWNWYDNNGKKKNGRYAPLAYIWMCKSRASSIRWDTRIALSLPLPPPPPLPLAPPPPPPGPPPRPPRLPFPFRLAIIQGSGWTACKNVRPVKRVQFSDPLFWPWWSHKKKWTERFEKSSVAEKDDENFDPVCTNKVCVVTNVERSSL